MHFSVCKQTKFDNLRTNNFVICMFRIFDTCEDNEFTRFRYVSYQSATSTTKETGLQLLKKQKSLELLQKA